MNNDSQFLNEEEKRIEEECGQERYLELYKDIEKEALQQGKNKLKHIFLHYVFSYV